MVRMIDLIKGKDKIKSEEDEEIKDKDADSQDDNTFIFERSEQKQREVVEDKEDEEDDEDIGGIFRSSKQRIDKVLKSDFTDRGIFEQPEKQEDDLDIIEQQVDFDKDSFVEQEKDIVLPEEDEFSQMPKLDITIELYNIGIELLFKISSIETIDIFIWEELVDFMDKIVDLAQKFPRITFDVATNYSSGSSYLHETIMNTCLLSIHTGIGMDYSKEQLIELGIAAFLHNIGKFNIEDIINYEGKLTSKQFATLKQYPEFSVQKLDELSADEVEPLQIENIRKGISQGRERIDGSGYPEGLEEEHIHPYAQIIGITNVYEAMTHPRPHREKKLPYAAMKEIYMLAGKQFNSKIVRIFVNQVSVYPVGSLVALNNGQVAKVVDANNNFPLRPVVAVLLDENKEILPQPKFVDLRKNMILHIRRSVDPEDIGIDSHEILNIRYEEEKSE